MANNLLRDVRPRRKITIQTNRRGAEEGANFGVFKELIRVPQTFYSKISTMLRQIAVARKLPADYTEDVIQEVWLAAWRNRRRFHGKDAVQQLCGWMRQVMRSKIADAFRQLYRHRALSLDALPVEMAEPDADQINLRRREWLAERLNETAAHGSLNARLLIGRFVHGLTNADLAAEEGLTEKAVESRICRLIEEFRHKAIEDALMDPQR